MFKESTEGFDPATHLQHLALESETPA